VSEFEYEAGVDVPSSIDKLFTELERHIAHDRSGLTIEESMTVQEFEWLTQEVLEECTDLEPLQIVALSRAVAEKKYLLPNYLESSITKLSTYLASIAGLVAVHPASVLPEDARQDVLVNTRHYASTLTESYEHMNPVFRAGKTDELYVRRVVGALAIHTERLTMPAEINPSFMADTGSLLMGVMALRGARYTSWWQHRRLLRAIMKANKMATDAEPNNTLYVPEDWQ
jgi:hypothetical protein